MSLAESPSAGETSPVVPRKFLFPFVLVTILFPLWGFANDITNPMVRTFQDIFQLSAFKSSLVQFAFYGGYATMAIPAALIIRKYSFKTGFLVGLGLYAVGALLFIPASISQAFGLFLVAYYVITFGLAFLETSANPYILSLGPIETATRRLNLAQSFNPMGSLLGMFVAAQLLMPSLNVNKFRDELDQERAEEFKSMTNAEVDEAKRQAWKEFAETSPDQFLEKRTEDLGMIRFAHVILGTVVLGIFLTFLASKLPDAPHDSEKIHFNQVLSRLKTGQYIGGVIAQTAYVGAQIMCWTFIVNYGVILLGMPSNVAQKYNIAAMIVFVSSRFICTLYLLPRFGAGRLLGWLAVGGMVLVAGTILLQGYPGIYCLVGVSACMSLMFPTIYGIALDGLTVDDAKLASAGLIFAIVGGCLMPPLQASIIDMPSFQIAGRTFESVRASFILPLLCFVVVAVYGFATARRTADAAALSGE